MEPASDTPASDLLRADHRKMEKHLDSLLLALKHLSAERVADIRRDLAALQTLANPHFDKEEVVYYPFVRPLCSEAMTLMEEEHAAIRETEKCFGELLESFPALPAKRDLDELYRLGIEYHDAIEVHIVDEEDQLLKRVDRLLLNSEQQWLAAAMLQTTRPGTQPPNKPN